MQFAKYLHSWLFQLGQNIRSEISTGKEKKRLGQMSFICPWARRRGPDGWTVTTSYVCSRKRVTSSGACVRTTFTFSACILSVMQFSEQVGIQRRTWPITDVPAAEGIAPVTFQLWTEWAFTTGPPCSPSGEALFWSQLHVGHQTELCGEKMCQGQMIYFCSFVDFFASHYSVLGRGIYSWYALWRSGCIWEVNINSFPLLHCSQNRIPTLL